MAISQPVDAAQAQRVLQDAVDSARQLAGGETAGYIPELANAPLEATAAAITLTSGRTLEAGDSDWRFTLQSTAKVTLLAGLLEDVGEERVFSLVGKEPSGGGFASVARIETHGPKPANPLINAGAIALSSLLGGNLEDRLEWIEKWCERLYGRSLPINARVLASERRTGDRNRAIAYLLRGHGVFEDPTDLVLETYFALCSLEANAAEASFLPAVLAAGGQLEGAERVLSKRTVRCVVSLMTTCGMYDESGAHLVQTGLPAKSGVSGVIIAAAPGRAGIAVASPRINAKGGSVRGHAILDDVSRELDWHFA